MDNNCSINKDDIENAVLDALEKHNEKKRIKDRANLRFWRACEIAMIIMLAIFAYLFLFEAKLYAVNGVMMNSRDLKQIVTNMEENGELMKTAEERMKNAQQIEIYSGALRWGIIFFIVVILFSSIGIYHVFKQDSKEATSRVTFYIVLADFFLSLYQLIISKSI